MAVVQLLFYVLVVFTLGHRPVHGQINQGDVCKRSDGSVGVCRLIGDCEEAKIMIASGRFPEICSYNRNIPIVCCPLLTKPTATRTPTTRTTTTQRVATRRATRPPPPTTTTTTTRSPLKPVPILAMAGKSWENCVKYAEAVRVEVYSPILTLNPDPIYEIDCAQSVQELIINGEKVLPKEYPHMAAIGFGDANNIAWQCGGSLISERFVLTAAHCLAARGRGSVRWVRLGDLNMFDTVDESKPQTFEVVERIPHPEYKAPSHYHDIALLRLNATVKFDPFVRPACLHTNRTTPEGHIATATGWGITEWTEEKGSNDLMKVDLRFVNPSQCNNTYKTEITQSSRLLQGFQDDMMVCAGDSQDLGRDTCLGDSGGPLQLPITVPYCMYSIVGLTSFGVSACGVSNSPAVYTRVSYYVPWIESVVWPNTG